VSAIDLNSDLGEWDLDEASSDALVLGDAAMFDVITSANVAAGFHAGSPDSMAASATQAAARGVSLGVHPSYRDRDGFGRRNQDVASTILIQQMLEQVESLSDAAQAAGTRVRYLKPHGALYNRISVDDQQADAVARAAKEANLPILGLAGTAIQRAAEAHGVQFYREAFVDRAYLPDGTLAPRSLSGAVIVNRIAAGERALRMAVDGHVIALDGSLLRIELDSLCVHGDTEGAFLMASSVRELLVSAGLEIRAFA